jgi:hypothetical protein
MHLIFEIFLQCEHKLQFRTGCIAGSLSITVFQLILPLHLSFLLGQFFLSESAALDNGL